MKRCAFFVEGQTEMVFVSRLLTEIANKGQIAITKMKASGGAKSPRTLLVIEATRPDPKQEYFVLIVDSGGDSTVKSDVIDQYQSLVGAGYEAIVAIRDVYPLAMGDVGSLRTGLAAGLPQGPVLPVFVLGIMEIESWFLAEHTHYPHLDAQLTAQRIKADLGFDPSVDDMQLRATPAPDLNAAYSLVGMAYKKNRKSVERTVDLLDYARMYLEFPGKFGDVAVLMKAIDQFFTIKI